VDQSVLLEVEILRRANVARLREKYREVFGEQTRSRHQRAQEIANDADLQLNRCCVTKTL
jgi:hypothetical protein